MNAPRVRRGLLLLVTAAVLSHLALAADPPPAPAGPGGPLVLTKTVPFRQHEPIKLGLAAGGLRLGELTISPTEGTLLDSALPPRGGQESFSWLKYAVAAENPGGEDWWLAVRVRLLDKKGVVIDEFDFRRGVAAGRARSLDFKRLTLNYVVPLIDKVELALSAEQ